MKKTTFGKRLSAGILAMLILLGALPVIALPGFAANETGSTLGEYVALPITIRDYAADGMLFEWNELGATGDQTIYDGNVPTPTVNLAGKEYLLTNTTYSVTENADYIRYTVNDNGAYITYGFDSMNYTRSKMRYCVVSYRTDSNYASKPTIGHRTNNGNYYVNLTTDGYNIGLTSSFKNVVIDFGSGNDKVNYVTIYPRLPQGKSFDIEYIAFFESKDDANRYANGGVSSSVYHHGGTRGYGLLQTIEKDHLNNLQTSEAITGSQLVQNGTWNSAPAGTVGVELNSGAKQLLYGAYVRTNLVEAKLVDGKPVYTEATVKYLAEYMSETLTEVWQNPDGTHNMWYVMGTKLFDDNNNYVGNNSKATRDLAEVFRNCITGGLGDYASTKSKTLTKATDCKTYYDAAYFLLSTLFSDNDGYGQTVSEYHQINLVKKGNAYVFNSAYDDSVYDMKNGVIYNSQTDNITARVDSNGNTESPRGNLLPENRFNPINGLYYGNNGNEYLKISDANGKDLTYYYANTNYNLTLEGHAQFIFYEDDNMYFNFTGDDDVYLYINGIRVMDMGGAHSISKCGINLNDVKELCGLRDGEVYDFNFFYMERHGTAANFGIETNIRIVDPSMLTEKSAYQNGTEVGNGGLVDATAPVKYQYELTNNGEAKIVDLEFHDEQIGVVLTKDKITLNDKTKITDLYVAVYDKDGKVREEYQIRNLTEAKLKALLEAGLDVGERIHIFGFNYTIPDSEWSTDDKFTNTVYTKAVTDGSNVSYRTLTGIDTSTVKKATIVYDPLHYYEWAGHGVTAKRDELVQQVEKSLTAAGIDHTFTENDTITLCSASGTADTVTYKYNPNASVVDSGVEYVAPQLDNSEKHKTGSSVYYYKIGEYGPVSVTVYSYDVADDKFVIDYNLPVTFDGNNTFLKNDTLVVGENSFGTTAAFAFSGTTAYGTVNIDGMSLTYTMNKFMNEVEEITLTVTVLENGAQNVTAKTGVVMMETISIAPANVVYYEDDFADIKYIDGDGNTWEYYETSDRGTAQSPDQDTPYGSDPNYAGDKATEGYESNPILNAIKDWVSSISVFDFGTLLADDTAPTAENEGSGNAVGTTPIGDSSNGTIHRLCVQKTADVMSFEFKGTGFEILSRTTQDIYAVVSVKVVNSEGKTVKQFPVITECKGGDLYQVPILAVKGLPLDTYTVTLAAAGGTETKARTLYIDGVRIYQPLDEADQTAYYNAAEANAEFYEIKNLIGDGKAWYATFDEQNKQMVSGSTLIENVEEGGFERLVAIDDVTKYLEDGPNNELYLSGTYANSFLALKLKKKVGADVITVQVGAHRKASLDEFTSDGDSTGTYLVGGTSADDIINKIYRADVSSGTEQYLNIPLTDDDFDENGYCTLFIGAVDMENGYEALVLTNMKLKGVDVETYSAPTAEQLAADPLMAEAVALAAYYSDPYDPELSVVSADVLAIRGIFSKKTTVTLTVRADKPITRITVTDSEGNEVEVKQYTIGFPGYAKIITATWQTTASRGDVLEYTVRAYSADGLASVNTVHVTAKVK